ncbi:hypothetical protein [Streptomyces sp. GC420]|uniref:hypothetical protein n=1 Tax=Streptomyces sp. GC420 TaxID=2697568 RepID=UPI001414E488|nr:hypothetical protein [Streptomyces sp. GC420]NBM16122.1 hypothetical protein [Streptomyces sp. GC420]
MTYDDTPERLRVLEERVDALTQALRALIDGLEGTPDRNVESDAAARGARLAHELLLSQEVSAQPRAAGP